MNNVFLIERKRLKLTQEQLAKKLNTSRSNVANWENGQNMPSVDLIIKCSDIFRCDIKYLAGYQKNRTKVIDTQLRRDLENANSTLDTHNELIKFQQEKIKLSIEDLNQLQEEIFGGDEYLNWIVAELEKIKIRLLGEINE